MNATPARLADPGGPVALIEDSRALPGLLTLGFGAYPLWVFAKSAKPPSPSLPRVGARGACPDDQ